MLFWFGIVFEFIMLYGSYAEYRLHGQIKTLMPFESEQYEILNIINFIYLGFGHFIHIFAGYWIAKGHRKGVIIGIALSTYEIVSFLLPGTSYVLLEPSGIAIRIFFGVVIWLIITGRKDLHKLKIENWRPWKNPKTIRQ